MTVVSDLNEGHVARALIADALFCSTLETGATPTDVELATAIRSSLRRRRGWNGCTRAVAVAFTESPISAAEREAWCHQLAVQALNASEVRATLNRMA